MTVFKPESVSEQPIVEMSHWSFHLVCDEDGFITKHLVGVVNGFGRVSSPIENQVYSETKNNTIKTSSGRVYKLIGESKHHMDAQYIWSIWLEANNCWEVFE